MFSELLTIRETAELLAISQATLRSWIRDNVAPKYYKLNGPTYRFEKQDVIDWLEQQIESYGGTR